MLTIGLLLAITFLPGAVLFRLPVADRARRAALPADERAFWMVIISVGLSTTVAFALAALAAYTLERLVTVNLILADRLVSSVSQRAIASTRVLQPDGPIGRRHCRRR